ncbi:hypothetical protein PSCICG_14040 [Pseudomonas cichorii]|nr:hypothetical protein PSCICG_14040 [Pseudomonas cichorii]
MKQAGDADTQGSRLIAQAAAELKIQRQGVFTDITAVTTEVLQVIRQGRLIEVAQHLAEEGFMLFLADTQQGLAHVVAKRHRRSQQTGLTTEAGLDFMAHHFQGAVVHGDVVELQGGFHALGMVGFVVDQTDQWCLAKIHDGLGLCRQGADLEPCLTPDNLHRGFQAIPMNRSTQDVVPFDHGLQRQSECVQTSSIGKGELHVHHIRVAVTGRDMVVKNALLQGRQRVDVLYIGCAAGNKRDQAVDSLLIQRHQGQHVRCDAGTAGRNTVFRQARGTAFCCQILALFDQLDQCRLVLAQVFHQALVGQRTAIALHHQLSILDRQIDVIGLQCRQEFVDAHRIISMLSVMAA